LYLPILRYAASRLLRMRSRSCHRLIKLCSCLPHSTDRPHRPTRRIMRQVMRHARAVPAITQLLVLRDRQREAIRPEDRGGVALWIAHARVKNAVRSFIASLPPKNLAGLPIIRIETRGVRRNDLTFHLTCQHAEIGVRGRAPREFPATVCSTSKPSNCGWPR
jgi:hypothetical protein